MVFTAYDRPLYEESDIPALRAQRSTRSSVLVVLLEHLLADDKKRDKIFILDPTRLHKLRELVAKGAETSCARMVEQLACEGDAFEKSIGGATRLKMCY